MKTLSKPYSIFFKVFGLSFLSILLLLCVSASAQYVPASTNYVINIDSVSHAPDKAIPFDQPFTVILRPRNPQNIVKVIAYPTILDAFGKPTISQTNINVGYIINTPPKIMGTLAVVNFPAIKPNYHFDFCLLRKLDTAVLDTFITFTNLVAKSHIIPGTVTSTQQNQADQNYNTFLYKIRNTPLKYNTTSSFIYDYLFEISCQIDNNSGCPNRSLEYLFGGNLGTWYTAIINLRVANPTYPGGVNALKNDLKTAMSLLTASTNKFNDGSINSLYKIVNSGRQNSLFTGLLTLNSNYQVAPANVEDIKQRLNNIKIVYRQLSGVQDTVERLLNETTVPVAPTTSATPAATNAALTANTNYQVLIRVNTYLKALVNNVNRGENVIAQNYAAIKNYFQNNPSFYYTEWYINNTDSFADLQSKSGSLFSPQLGISFLGVPKNEGGSQVIPKLAIGVNINFRSINKSLIRADIPNKTLAHYWSGFVGLTFGAFKDTQYTNLFASNSLLFGLNYRFTRSFYWSFGGCAFRQQDLNPIVNDSHTQLGIYTSLMLDVDIVNAASNITGILFK